MVNNSLDLCKLCCAPRGLINMFTGKCRTFRNILRKIVKDCLCIEVELDNGFQSICINCLIDVTNFYYFKLNCQQTQNNLKHNGSNNPVTKRPRIENTHLDEVELPDIAAITNVLDWLSSKQKDSKNAPEIRDCEEAKVNSVACQTTSIELRNQSCETTSINLKDHSSQTTSIKLKVQSCQANIDKPAQTIGKAEDPLPTTTHPKNKSKSVQCSLRCFKTDRPSVKTNFTQTDLTPMKLESTNQTGRGRKRSKKSFWKNEVFSPEAECLPKQNLDATMTGKALFSVERIQSVLESIKPASLSPASSKLLQVKSRKPMKVTICQYCDRSLYSVREVIEHKRTHMWCHICSKKFKTTKLAQNHIYSFHLHKHQDTEHEKLDKCNWTAYVDLLKVDKCSSFRTAYPAAYQYLSDLHLQK